jgi:hypothetical protein
LPVLVCAPAMIVPSSTRGMACIWMGVGSL